MPSSRLVASDYDPIGGRTSKAGRRTADEKAICGGSASWCRCRSLGIGHHCRSALQRAPADLLRWPRSWAVSDPSRFLNPFLPDPASPSVAAIYLTVKDTGPKADALVAATSPAAPDVMLMTENAHGSFGSMGMLRQLRIPASRPGVVGPGSRPRHARATDGDVQGGPDSARDPQVQVGRFGHGQGSGRATELDPSTLTLSTRRRRLQREAECSGPRDDSLSVCLSSQHLTRARDLTSRGRLRKAEVVRPTPRHPGTLLLSPACAG